MQFTFVKNAISQPTNTLTIDDLIKILRSEKIKKITEEYRSLLAEDTKKAKKYKETKIPAFTVSGIFNKTRNNKSLITPSNMLEIDIDLKGDLESRKEQAIKIKDALDRSPHMVANHVSLSYGYKGLFWFDTKQEITKSLLKTMGKFATTYILEYLDSHGVGSDFKVDPIFDIPRLCFFAYDESVKDFDIESKKPFQLTGSPESRIAKESATNFIIPKYDADQEYDQLMLDIDGLDTNGIIKHKIYDFLNSVDGEKYVNLRNSLFTTGGYILKQDHAITQSIIDVITRCFDFRIQDEHNTHRDNILKMFYEGTEKPFCILSFIAYTDDGKVKIDEYKYKIFLNKIFVMDKYGFIFKINDNNTLTFLSKDDRLAYHVIDSLENSVSPEKFNIYYRAIKTYLKPNVIRSFVKTDEIRLLKSDRYTSYFIFKNGVLSVNKNGMRLRPYEAYRDVGYIEEGHIVDFDFRLEREKPHTEFETFLKLTCSEYDRADNIILDKKKYKALRRSIGYLLHSFSESTDKAIVFTEKNISVNKHSANGGSGKTLIIEAVMKMYNLDKTVNGKGPDKKDKFYLDNLAKHTQLIPIDDISRDFDTTLLFTMVGKRFEICRKTQDKLSIGPVKIAITSNYPIKMKDNESLQRRVYIMELNRFFDIENKPEAHLNKRLYNVWNQEEWNAFYNFMVRLSLEYHKTRELVDYPNYNHMRTDLEKLNHQLFDYITSAIEDSPDGRLIIPSLDLTDMMKSITKKSYYNSIYLSQDLTVLHNLNLFEIDKKVIDGKTAYHILQTNNNMIKKLLNRY